MGVLTLGVIDPDAPSLLDGFEADETDEGPNSGALTSWWVSATHVSNIFSSTSSLDSQANRTGPKEGTGRSRAPQPATPGSSAASAMSRSLASSEAESTSCTLGSPHRIVTRLPLPLEDSTGAIKSNPEPGVSLNEAFSDEATARRSATSDAGGGSNVSHAGESTSAQAALAAKTADRREIRSKSFSRTAAGDFLSPRIAAADSAAAPITAGAIAAAYRGTAVSLRRSTKYGESSAAPRCAPRTPSSAAARAATSLALPSDTSVNSMDDETADETLDAAACASSPTPTPGPGGLGPTR